MIRRPWAGLAVAVSIASAYVLWPISARTQPAPHAAPAVRGASFDVLQLSNPLPARAYLAGASFDMGSSHEEMLSAHNECILEVLGHTCNAKQFQNEGPQRRVMVSSYLLDRYEVTLEQYDRCVAARRCAPAPYYKGAQRFRRGTLPVVLVAFSDAQAYCAFAGGRLPTEAEWERAARGTERRRYPWGNVYNSRVANHGRLAHNPSDDTDGFAELAPVGSFPAGATPELVFDLAGNVEEWTRDRYKEAYDPNDTKDPKGASPGSGISERSVRGGHYMSPRVSLRGAARTWASPAERHAGRGFRCARDVRQ